MQSTVLDGGAGAARYRRRGMAGDNVLAMLGALILAAFAVGIGRRLVDAIL